MARSSFILATDVRPGEAAWERVVAHAAGLAAFAARILGATSRVDVACLDARSTNEPAESCLGQVIDRLVGDEDELEETFVLPTAFELNFSRKSQLGEELISARRRHRVVSIHHDTFDPAHPLLLDCFAGQVLRGIQAQGVPSGQAGLLLVAQGEGGPATRADSYRLMRLLWEQTGLGRAEVGFVRHIRPSLRDTLERCLVEPLDWLLMPHCQWDGASCDDARVVLADHQRAHAEAAGWRLLDPLGDHPAILPSPATSRRSWPGACRQ